MSELSEKRSEQNDGFSINFNQDYTYVSPTPSDQQKQKKN